MAQMKSLKDKYTDRTFYVHVNDSPKDAECAHHTCGRGCTQICIRENGDVAPCIQFGMAYGNLVAQDPDELFNYKRIYPFLNFAEPDLETCQDCKHAMGCGGCAAIGWDKAVSECAWKQKHMDLINKIKQLQYTGNEEIQ